MTTSAPPLPDPIETRLFINGEFVPALDGSTFALKSPFSGETVANVAEAKAADVDRAVECAKAAFPAWEALDGSERRRLMLKLADLVDEHAAEFARLEALSMGKPVSGYMDQVMGTATLRYYAGKALDIHGITSLTSQNHLNLSLRQPYGVTGAIIPWNVPLIMLCFKVGPALTAGNTLIVKSSEKAPLTSLLFARLAAEVGYPPGVLNILSGFGMPCGDAIARHMEIRKIAFTGSTRTGRLIQRAAVESNLKSCTLELGYVCMASSRVYVHRNVAGKFKDLYAQAIARLAGSPGDPNNAATSFGPQADEQQVKSVRAYLELAQREDLQRLPLGELDAKVNAGANFVAPVVLLDVPGNNRLMREEIFGSVSCLNTFHSEDEVIRAANDSEFGLYASVFTRDINRAIQVARHFEAGSVAVNTSSPYYCQDLPLGGFKGSGTGRELGDEGLQAWTETKSVFIKLS
ncbi:Aldehyde/histidinol dehydrogenase [Aspergillus stella-maris]|uniref:Aldehyde/histidinol dehydrogenase n=1 Tax=Aspergillus stella-maris TaxID=1810926 RepID=UPI003CCCCF19